MEGFRLVQRLVLPTIAVADGRPSTRLEDLRSNLPQGAWEALLAAIRSHLEQGTPLDAELRVQLNDGRIEWWRVTGAVQRNVGGQPVYVSGRMQDVTAETRRGTPSADPS